MTAASSQICEQASSQLDGYLFNIYLCLWHGRRACTPKIAYGLSLGVCPAEADTGFRTFSARVSGQEVPALHNEGASRLLCCLLTDETLGAQHRVFKLHT